MIKLVIQCYPMLYPICVTICKSELQSELEFELHIILPSFLHRFHPKHPHHRTNRKSSKLVWIFLAEFWHKKLSDSSSSVLFYSGDPLFSEVSSVKEAHWREASTERDGTGVWKSPYSPRLKERSFEKYLVPIFSLIFNSLPRTSSLFTEESSTSTAERRMVQKWLMGLPLGCVRASPVDDRRNRIGTWTSPPVGKHFGKLPQNFHTNATWSRCLQTLPVLSVLIAKLIFPKQ